MVGAGLDEELEPNHEINVTPFIDVILVLLIVFMIAAPLATVDTPVDLPSSTANREPADVVPLYVTVSFDGSWHVNNTLVEPRMLATALDDITHYDRQRRVLLRADRKVAYERLVDAMNALREAGYTRLALVGVELQSP